MDKTVILRPADWPTELRTLWEAGTRPPILPNDPCGAGARWRRQTVKTTEASLGCFLYFATERGWDITGPSLTRLVTKERVQPYLSCLAERNSPATVLHRCIGLERGWAVLAPKSNRSLLRLIIADLEDHFEPASKRERLQETAALLGLGRRLMDAARGQTGRYPFLPEVQFRNGLKTGVLARRPIRLRNLSMMLVGRHVVKVGGIWRMRFEGYEVKNGKPIDVVFPEDLVEDLEHYISMVRPVLAGARYKGTALWVSAMGNPLSPVSINQQLCKVTRDAFGLPISPHLFRDCAATSLAVHAPELVQIAHLILGNTYSVMERHYNLARVVEAGHHFYATLGLD